MNRLSALIIIILAIILLLCVMNKEHLTTDNLFYYGMPKSLNIPQTLYGE